mmetsp:Transcript_39998/g.103312  ORF Transcript_39998/g.103312 Transcript_39998/m.103312 type:complete len:188 (-) Transcript_39998:14326-14889(-)
MVAPPKVKKALAEMVNTIGRTALTSAKQIGQRAWTEGGRALFSFSNGLGDSRYMSAPGFDRKNIMGWAHDPFIGMRVRGNNTKDWLYSAMHEGGDIRNPVKKSMMNRGSRLFDNMIKPMLSDRAVKIDSAFKFKRGIPIAQKMREKVWKRNMTGDAAAQLILKEPDRYNPLHDVGGPERPSLPNFHV